MNNFVIRNSFLLEIIAFVFLSLLWPGMRKTRSKVIFWCYAVFMVFLFLKALHLRNYFSLISRFLVITWFTAILFWAVAGLLVIVLKAIRYFTKSGVQTEGSYNNWINDSWKKSGFFVLISGISFGIFISILSFLPFKVRHEIVYLDSLPPQLEGLKIGLISDIHIGPFNDPQLLEAAIDTMNNASTSLQFMTGDMIDDPKLLDKTFKALNRTNATFGFFTILGNHERIYSPYRILDAYHEKSGDKIHLLINKNYRLPINDTAINIVGVDYPNDRWGNIILGREEQDNYMQEVAGNILPGLSSRFTICLTHHPNFFNYASSYGVQLTLAGHTHGGQIKLLRKLLPNFDFMQGWYSSGKQKLFVTSGVGAWVPIRIGIPPEVVIITLHRSRNIH